MNFRNISSWCIRHPVPPIVLFIGLLLAGIVAFAKMDVNNLPDVEFPMAIVSAGTAVWTSQIALGQALRAQRLLLIPEESWSPPVLRRAWLHASRLARPAPLAVL